MSSHGRRMVTLESLSALSDYQLRKDVFYYGMHPLARVSGWKRLLGVHPPQAAPALEKKIDEAAA